MTDLKGKIALVTGGAMGMGRYMAEFLLDEGAKVIITDVNEKELKNTLKELEDKGEASGYISDVSSIDDIKSLKEKVHREIGKLDILINNAGIVFGGFLKDLSIEQIKKTIDVDLFGVVYMTKIFLTDFLEKEEGHIVNIASAAGLLGVPKLVPYCTAKFGVVGFSEALRLEFEHMGYSKIKVSTVCPSYVSTGMFDGVTPPKLTKFIKPTTMAHIIIDGIKEDKPCIMAPYAVKLIPFLKSIFPANLVDRLSAVLGVTSSADGLRGRGN